MPVKELSEIKLSEQLEGKIKQFKSLNPVNENKEYMEQLVPLVAELRCSHNLNYDRISEILGVKGSTIFNIIRDYPVSTGKNGNLIKNAINREEKRIRNSEMVRMNALDGITLEGIAQEFDISKQRVSAIFKQLKYTPLDSEAVSKLDANKHSATLIQAENETLQKTISELKGTISSLRQADIIQKSHYAKLTRELRIKLFCKIMANPTINDIKDYKIIKKTLVTYYNKLVGTDNTDELNAIEQLLKEADLFEVTPRYLKLVKQLTSAVK